jgi:hypothetical protein
MGTLQTLQRVISHKRMLRQPHSRYALEKLMQGVIRAYPAVSDALL